MKLATASNPIMTVFVCDDSGKGITGLVASTFPPLAYVISGANASIAFPALNDLPQITTSYNPGGIKERSGGYYRIDGPIAMTSTEGSTVTIIGEGPNQHVICPPLDIGAVTIAAIRQDLDANSTKLAAAATSNDVTTAVNAILTAVGSPLQAANYVASPSALSIATATAASLFVDGSTNLLKVNPDHSINSNVSTTIENYVTIPAAVAIASQNPATITCVRGDTLRVSLPLLGNVTGRNKLILSAKAAISDSDSLAVLQVMEDTGLTRLNGHPPLDPATASLTVNDATTGAVNLIVNASATSQLPVGDLTWDCQMIASTGVVTPVSGTFTVVADVTQAVT